MRQENLRKRERKREQSLQEQSLQEQSVQEQNLQKQMFIQSLNEQMAMQDRERQQTAVQMAMQSPQEGLGYTLIPQDVGQAAQRLNLLCGSVSAGNDNKQLKNEISVILEHLYKQKVLSKPEIKKLIKRYCF